MFSTIKTLTASPDFIIIDGEQINTPTGLDGIFQFHSKNDFVLNEATNEELPTDDFLFLFDLFKQEQDKKIEFVPSENDLIISQLDEIDKKKVRAITDALISNDITKLQALEDEAKTLRAKLK